MEKFVSTAIITSLVIIIIISPVLSTQVCTDCDCIIRDGMDGNRGNINVQPICKDGKISWMNPTNAIRLELRPRLAGDFRACVVVKSEGVKTMVSKETAKDSVVNYRTQTIESKMALEHWFMASGHSKEYCVTSSKDHVILYLEVEATTESDGLSRVSVFYDVENGVPSSDAMAECQPCDDKTILRTFCSSEFAVIGRMAAVTEMTSEEKTRIDVTLDEIIRQKEDHFNTKRNNGETNGAFFNNLRCGSKLGPGKFLFLGGTKLGRPTLQCAPYYDDWLSIVQTARDAGTLECSIS